MCKWPSALNLCQDELPTAGTVRRESICTVPHRCSSGRACPKCSSYYTQGTQYEIRTKQEHAPGKNGLGGRPSRWAPTFCSSRRELEPTSSTKCSPPRTPTTPTNSITRFRMATCNPCKTVNFLVEVHLLPTGQRWHWARSDTLGKRRSDPHARQTPSTANNEWHRHPEIAPCPPSRPTASGTL